MPTRMSVSIKGVHRALEEYQESAIEEGYSEESILRMSNFMVIQILTPDLVVEEFIKLKP